MISVADLQPNASTQDPFVPFRHADPARPFVVAQLGQSLDGRIATITGMSKYINGAPALDHLHRIRAEVDAVVVGASTVVADDPQLTVRRVPGRSPARVVIDPTGRLKGPAKWHEAMVRRASSSPPAQWCPCRLAFSTSALMPKRAPLRRAPSSTRCSSAA